MNPQNSPPLEGRALAVDAACKATSALGQVLFALVILIKAYQAFYVPPNGAHPPTVPPAVAPPNVVRGR